MSKRRARQGNYSADHPWCARFKQAQHWIQAGKIESPATRNVDARRDSPGFFNEKLRQPV
jgi:hypothetical protein